MSEPERRRKILVMDDEADIRELVDLMLRPKGIDVIKAADWGEGIKALEEHADIEMVLLDLTLPGAVGTPVDAVQSIREGTPVVMMSGYGAPRTEDMTGAYQPTAFLQKPFRPAALHETVERYTSQRPPNRGDS